MLSTTPYFNVVKSLRGACGDLLGNRIIYHGKLVISTPRAAIPDMLTATDGSRCGIIVDEQNVEQLTEAINWAYTHNAEADELCKKAYEKVYNSYRTEVVYELYRSLYRKLL